MKKIKVLVIVGSKSDIEAMAGCGELLEKFNIPYTLEISSAHRQPDKTIKLLRQAELSGAQIIIAAAGMAAHLPGFIASQTILPVIGVPLSGSALSGVDALYSIVQMPAGVPVATMAIGSHGAKNAALLAVEILSLGDEKLKKMLIEYRKNLGGK